MTQSQQRALRELDLVLRRIKAKREQFARKGMLSTSGFNACREIIAGRKREIRKEGKKP